MTREVGPVEAKILAELPSSFKVLRREAKGAFLRYLEGGSGETIVLLHGRGAASTAWYPLLPQLAKTNRVVAVDLPGFGLSEPSPSARADSIEGCIEFFTGPVEALLHEIAPQPALVAGHSLGGFVTTEIALRGAVKPRAIALVAAMGVGASMKPEARFFFRAGPERLFARRLGKRVLDTILGFDDGPISRRLNDLLFELYAIDEGRALAQRAFDGLCPLFGALPNRSDRLGEIDVPALVYWGERDEVFPAHVARSAAKRLKHARLIVEPAFGHAPHHQAPDRAVELLASFATAAGRR